MLSNAEPPLLNSGRKVFWGLIKGSFLSVLGTLWILLPDDSSGLFGRGLLVGLVLRERVSIGENEPETMLHGEADLTDGGVTARRCDDLSWLALNVRVGDKLLCLALLGRGGDPACLETRGGNTFCLARLACTGDIRLSIALDGRGGDRLLFLGLKADIALRLYLTDLDKGVSKSIGDRTTGSSVGPNRPLCGVDKGVRLPDGDGVRLSEGDGVRLPGGDGVRLPDGDGERKTDGDSVRIPDGDGERQTIGDGERLTIGDGVRLPDGDGDCRTIGDGVRLPIGDGERLTIGDGVRLPDGDGERITIGDGEALPEGDGDRLLALLYSANMGVLSGDNFLPRVEELYSKLLGCSMFGLVQLTFLTGMGNLDCFTPTGFL